VGNKQDNWLRDWWPQIAACALVLLALGGLDVRIRQLEEDSEVLKDIRDRVVRVETKIDGMKHGGE
jgi:hypothetical protein